MSQKQAEYDGFDNLGGVLVCDLTRSIVEGLFLSLSLSWVRSIDEFYYRGNHCLRWSSQPVNKVLEVWEGHLDPNVNDAKELLTKLLNNEARCFIISIYGMGGLDEPGEMNDEDLGRYLLQSLQGCFYLPVIDDVWNKEAWMSLKVAFLGNKTRSRVIITTRSKEVAESSDERTHTHNLHYLRQDESWQLFYEKTFQHFNTDEELNNLGREMVQKCNGQPLAIIVLGGILFRKRPQE
ncbi:hypothetical protein EZV62_006162 [Acer yangbiense]|uniref:NB-ARC domain-containing protein n=1 Tax=Acer yangbiense TaxID=1000413 RepID=A0A5C7IPB9_9ROSI|nr:hypothetical protein EZV62_006162 [Acer yangbiense]